MDKFYRSLFFGLSLFVLWSPATANASMKKCNAWVYPGSGADKVLKGKFLKFMSERPNDHKEYMSFLKNNPRAFEVKATAKKCAIRTFSHTKKASAEKKILLKKIDPYFFDTFKLVSERALKRICDIAQKTQWFPIADVHPATKELKKSSISFDSIVPVGGERGNEPYNGQAIYSLAGGSAKLLNFKYLESVNNLNLKFRHKKGSKKPNISHVGYLYGPHQILQFTLKCEGS